MHNWIIKPRFKLLFFPNVTIEDALPIPGSINMLHKTIAEVEGLPTMIKCSQLLSRRRWKEVVKSALETC